MCERLGALKIVLSANKNVLWYEERASSDAALTKPDEIEHAHSTLLTCLYLVLAIGTENYLSTVNRKPVLVLN